ncbi:hypothetical protein DO70_5360 [Burkholderia pseudomallei]|nr:hypothetical protein DO70_5360 [Burkholderia pseudomallei]
MRRFRIISMCRDAATPGSGGTSMQYENRYITY